MKRCAGFWMDCKVFPSRPCCRCNCGNLEPFGISIPWSWQCSRTAATCRPCTCMTLASARFEVLLRLANFMQSKLRNWWGCWILRVPHLVPGDIWSSSTSQQAHGPGRPCVCCLKAFPRVRWSVWVFEVNSAMPKGRTSQLDPKRKEAWLSWRSANFHGRVPTSMMPVIWNASS